MKKTVVSIFLVLTLTISGCGSKDEEQNVKVTSKNETRLETIDVSTADGALERLKSGNEAFVKGKSEMINISKDRREDLEKGQNPFAIVVSCSDSRVTPAHVFDTGLGDIFEIRLAGNVVDELALGSIEYGVEHLGSPLLLVMGHENCGAVTATYNCVKDNKEDTSNIGRIVEEIKPSVLESKDIEEASHKNVEAVIKKIEEDQCIKKYVDEGKLKIVGAYYNLNGEVTFN